MAGAARFGVGTTEAMVVGRSGGPKGGAAGACGATVVTAEGAGMSAGGGGTIGRPGESALSTGPGFGALKKALASSAIRPGSGQDGAGIEKPHILPPSRDATAS